MLDQGGIDIEKPNRVKNFFLLLPISSHSFAFLFFNLPFTKDGDSPLVVSLLNTRLTVSKILLEQGANVNAMSSVCESINPLYFGRSDLIIPLLFS